MSFSKFIQLCSYHHNLLLECPMSHREVSCDCWQSVSAPQLVAGNPWSASHVCNSAFSRISWKWNHKMWFFSFSSMILRFIHVVAFISSLLLFMMMQHLKKDLFIQIKNIWNHYPWCKLMFILPWSDALSLAPPPNFSFFKN